MLPAQEIMVMLVDDDDVAVEGVMRGIKKHGSRCNVVTAADGLEAIEILRGQHPEKQIKMPYIVLLDLNMPRMDGFSFLKTVRADKDLHGIVVFVLSTSAREHDVRRAYHENAAGYMVKSMMGPHFSKLTTLLDCYGQSVSLPPRMG